MVCCEKSQPGRDSADGQDLRVYEQGEKSANASLAFCQMARPNPDNPTCIIGMEPPALVRCRTFGSCAQLHQRVTTYLEQRTVFNMTPKFSFVDLHIGVAARRQI